MLWLCSCLPASGPLPDLAGAVSPWKQRAQPKWGTQFPFLCWASCCKRLSLPSSLVHWNVELQCVTPLCRAHLPRLYLLVFPCTGLDSSLPAFLRRGPVRTDSSGLPSAVIGCHWLRHQLWAVTVPKAMQMFIEGPCPASGASRSDSANALHGIKTLMPQIFGNSVELSFCLQLTLQIVIPSHKWISSSLWAAGITLVELPCWVTVTVYCMMWSLCDTTNWTQPGSYILDWVPGEESKLVLLSCYQSVQCLSGCFVF